MEPRTFSVGFSTTRCTGRDGILDAPRQEVDRGATDRVARRADRGERRSEQLGHLVVVRDDRQVTGHRDAAVEGQVDERHRLGIGVDEDRGDRVRQRRVERGVDDRREVGARARRQARLEVVGRREAQLDARGLPAGRDLAGRRRVPRDDEADAAMAERGEVARGEHRAERVVGRDVLDGAAFGHAPRHRARRARWARRTRRATARRPARAGCRCWARRRARARRRRARGARAPGARPAARTTRRAARRAGRGGWPRSRRRARRSASRSSATAPASRSSRCG